MSEFSIHPFSEEQFIDYDNWCKFQEVIRKAGSHKERDKLFKHMFKTVEHLYALRRSYINATENPENPVSAHVVRSDDNVAGLAFVRKVDALFLTKYSPRKETQQVLGSAVLVSVLMMDETTTADVLPLVDNEYPGRELAAREPMVKQGLLRSSEYLAPVLDSVLIGCFDTRVEGQYTTHPNGVGKPVPSVLYTLLKTA